MSGSDSIFSKLIVHFTTLNWVITAKLCVHRNKGRAWDYSILHLRQQREVGDAHHCKKLKVEGEIKKK